MSRSSISVVVPSFNHADYIERAVESVLAHDGPDLEVVVVDDGSTDASMEKLGRYRHESRVRIFAQENRGAHAALNRAINLSQGEVIFVLNSDDTYEPDRISMLTAHLEDNPDVSLVATWISIIDADGHEIGIKKGWSNLPPWPPPTRGPYLSDLGDPTLALLETNYLSTSSNLVFRKSLFIDKGIRFQPLRYAHDWDFALASSAHGGIDVIEEPLLNYRAHASNTIREGSREGMGVMRFEIQWAVARHAHQVVRRCTERGLDSAELVRLLWNSMPSFGHEEILDHLLLIRGSDDAPPPAFDALLGPFHPLSRASIEVLSDE